jgi:hypothetical protein
LNRPDAVHVRAELGLMAHTTIKCNDVWLVFKIDAHVVYAIEGLQSLILGKALEVLRQSIDQDDVFGRRSPGIFPA